jgi:hypothetical protein
MASRNLVSGTEQTEFAEFGTAFLFLLVTEVVELKSLAAALVVLFLDVKGEVCAALL